MADDKSATQPTQYACKCLNVRISSSRPSLPPPNSPHDSNYTPVFVKEDGISVVHPQVTVRLTSKSEPISGTLKHSRFTVLTCLFCFLPIYRVHHTISPDVEGNESTLLPTEDWVEHEIMKSANGWIDVHNDSIAGERIYEAESSSSYAPPFSVIMPLSSSPPSPSPPPPSLSETPDELLTPQKTSLEAPTPEYLSHLRPLFLPPPFTSSHPIFVLLAELATKKSQELRASAEQRIANLVKAETAGLETKEKELQRQVEILWKNFRHNLKTVQQDRGLNTSRSQAREPLLSNGVVSPSQTATSVTIRNFVPEIVSSTSSAPSSSAPRVSTLSASLATSKFQYPERSERRLSATESTISVSSPRSASSTLVHATPRGDGSNVLQFDRNIDDNINTQASYRYLLNLDEEIKRFKLQQEAARKQQGSELPASSKEAGPSLVDATPNTNGNDISSQSQNRSRSPTSEGESRNTTPSRGRDKGKRKVTFDVKPAVVTIENEDNNKPEDTEEPMIFPLEEFGNEEDVEQSPTAAKANQLPLLEQVPRPPRERIARLHSGMETFAALRPSSLPVPSHIRPIRSQPGVDSSSNSVIRASPRSTVKKHQPTASTSFTSSTPVSETDAAILKLVAAHTPSHRGAWTPDSKAWQTFTRRREPQEVDRDDIPEEGEEDEGLTDATQPLGIKAAVASNSDHNYDAGHPKPSGVPASLPVNIALPKAREQLTLASYRPATILIEEPVDSPSTVPSPGKKGPSSTSIRRAMYAERDRSRAMDPGVLDFVNFITDKDDEEQIESEQDSNKPEDAGEKARKQALKILQARSDLPAEGMWRSLA